ncbi:hypothetical protein [Actinacidiphila bryophytorum]|uniref:hypothetical protein n=1 Tax=Actinacidiphila bryophytorum TaxID=1436133 RepID=UPI002176CB55|nr:hypothetical protein [Actinacidiphila bryophytorum]UWE07444.1 hypothetical protein NYE86_00985 [Actinacidiphila bryophytorum]
MGNASRKRQKHQIRAGKSITPRGAGVADETPGTLGEAALKRLLSSNAPGRLSLAGAYAFGYGELAMAQQGSDAPPWYQKVDPLDALFLGAVWPARTRSDLDFANARDAWLRSIRGTVHDKGVRRFVIEVVSASEELGLPVDDGELMLALTGRLEAAGLDQRFLPRRVLPENALHGCRSLHGPSPDMRLPDPPEDARKLVKRFWKNRGADAWAADSPCAVLREGLRRFHEVGLPVEEESATLLVALYARLLAKPGELLSDTGEHAEAWALSLDEQSTLVPVLDVLLVAPELGMPTDSALGHLFALPAFTEPIPSDALLWTSSPGLALPRLAFELGIPEVHTRDAEITPDLLDWAGMHTRMRLRATAHESAEESGQDSGDRADGTREMSEEQWAERRATVLDKIHKKSSATPTTHRSNDRPVERIWNADGSSVIRISTGTPVGREVQEGLEGQAAAFRDKFGREPGPGDPLFFDPDADEPTPLSREHFDNVMLDMAARAAELGMDPAFLLAWREVGYVVTEENMSMFTTAEVLVFSRAVARHQRSGE